MPDRRIDIRPNLVLADIAFLPADTCAQEETVTLRQILQQLGVSDADPGARPDAGVEHQRVDIRLVE